MFEKWLRARFVALHGEGEPHQADVFRCERCNRLITWNQVRAGFRCHQGRVIPAEPKFFEAVRLLLWGSK